MIILDFDYLKKNHSRFDFANLNLSICFFELSFI
jgi:hypothetical protein